MKSKQLANVLVKILGLSLCVEAVMHILTGLFNILAATGGMGARAFLWPNFLSGLVLAAIGICFIARSQNVAGYLLEGEDELHSEAQHLSSPRGQ